MSDLVSVFDGIKPIPTKETTWQKVLSAISSGKFRDDIARARTIKDPDAYREYKKKLKAVTFCSTFEKNRDRSNVKCPTGFIIPDLDHLPNTEETFQSIIQDENIWFAFRSPSGEGIKCGLRAKEIKNDDDIKKFFAACHRYFKETYNLQLDPACKDITRLTFVSDDPHLFINPNPSFFNIEQWTSKPTERFYMPPTQNNGWKSKYGMKVLESSCLEIESSPKGQQHNTRLRMARVIGGFIASGYIDEGEALNALEGAVRTSGAVMMVQAMKTVRDGIEHGKLSPIHPEERAQASYQDRNKDIDYYCDIDEAFGAKIEDIELIDQNETDEKVKIYARHVVNNRISSGKIVRLTECQKCGSNENIEAHHNDYDNPLNVIWLCKSCHQRFHRGLPLPANKQNKQNKQNNHDKRGEADSKHIVSDGKQETKIHAGKAPFNLAANIKEWVDNSTGSFTVDQIDREFCLPTRTETNNRYKILHALTDIKKINKDIRIKGKYHIIDDSLKTIDLFSVTDDPFNIILPFSLHKHCMIPKKAIVVIAGSSNAGKTALLLHTLQLNIQQQYQKLYLMSEMGAGEYKRRVTGLENINLKEWQDNVTASERPTDFNGAIEHHNRDGLTCIDFLEEVDGEYYRMSSDIRKIYDSLGDGVAIIAIQKKTTEEYARGGQATAEKARLYMTVDLIQVEEHSIVCSLKILKLKNFIGKNLQGHECFFEIYNGSRIRLLMDWKPVSAGNRALLKSHLNNDDYVITFQTASGRTVGVNSKHYEQWMEAYPSPHFAKVIQNISDSTFNKQWLTDKNWFWTISGMLKKELGGN